MLYLLLKHFKFLFTATSFFSAMPIFILVAVFVAAATRYPLNFQMPL